MFEHGHTESEFSESDSSPRIFRDSFTSASTSSLHTVSECYLMPTFLKSYGPDVSFGFLLWEKQARNLDRLLQALPKSKGVRNNPAMRSEG
jgi:hypothetical protein